MNDHTVQWNQIQRIPEAKKAKKAKPSPEEVEVSGLEWFGLAFIAIIADLLGPFGFPLAIIICAWYTFKFHKVPTKKLIGSGVVEIVSLGIFPGWIGFVVATYVELKLAKKGINLPTK